MKIILLVILIMPVISHATDDCLFPPCPDPPTELEFMAVDKMFVKVKYILGAAYQIKDHEYKNIPEYVSKTKKIRRDLVILHKQAKKLNKQKNWGQVARRYRQSI